MRLAVPPHVDPAALAGWDARAAVTDLSGATMGTVWRVRLAVPAGADLAALRRAIVARLDGVVAQMSHWDAGSLLSRFNAAAGGTWMTLPADFARVMAAALDVARRSDGAFDPAVGRLVDAWGHGPTGARAVPGDAHVAAALGVSGWRRVAFDAVTGRLHQPGGVMLDLSGIAKGFAVDAVADVLAAHDVAHGLVEIGGECAGRGMRPDGDPWWVELETPPGTALPPLRVALHQLAVATSGDYVRGAHTIDPRTGHPATGVVAASVVHRSAMLADAFASALMVLPRDEAEALAAREGLAVRVVARGAGRAEEWFSAAFRAMMA
jgi:thiamine biosynthesis lipoprotein